MAFIANDLVLTIAIPTYNRALLLEETLRSLIPQVREAMEIVVCSNGSTDNTDDLMMKYCREYSFIRYVKSNENAGIDANIHKCTQEARGKFIHLMSDDDILLEGAIDNLLETIVANPTSKFFYFNAQIFDGNFDSNKLRKPIFSSSANIVFTSKDKFIEYIWVWATFLSSFVIERATWNLAEDPEQYIGTDIYLSYMLFELLSRSEQMVLVAKPSVAIRAQYTGNYRVFYAFAKQWRRLVLEKAPVLGYDRMIMEKVFKKSIVRDILPRVVEIKIRSSGYRLDKESLSYIIGSTYDFRSSWIFLYPVLLMPKPFVKILWKFLSQMRLNPNNYSN